MRITLAMAVACLTIGAVAAADQAAAAIRKPTEIPAQGLGPALTSLAKEFDFQVLYRTEVVGTQRTQGVSGAMTAAEALERVLSGTGLTYKYLDDKTVTIIPTPSVSSISGEHSAAQGEDSTKGSDNKEGTQSKSFWDRFRVAQVDQGAQSQPSTIGSNTAITQKDPNKEVGLEEVVVTAQKREERLIDVPISIVAISAEDLAKRKITNIDDLPMAVPGLTIESLGNQRRIYMRGVGNVAGTGSLTGVYLDEAAITPTGINQLNIQTYDLQRVEVLRGPQGTLYGEGSTGGTIRFITNDPTLSRFQMNADFAGLFTQDGEPGQRIQAAINVPLIENELGIRIAGQFDHEGGWIDQPTANEKDVNGQNIADIRTKLLWKPSQSFGMTGMVEIHRNDAGYSLGEDANGNYTQPFGLTTIPHVTDDFELYNLNITYDFAAVRLLNTIGYVHQDNESYNIGIHPSYFGPPPAPTFGGYLPHQSYIQNMLNDELRLTSAGSGPWQWTIGSFYKDSRTNTAYVPFYYALEVPLGGPPPAPSPGDPGSIGRSESWSIFGDANYQLGNRFTVGAGVRNYSDRESGYGQSGRFHSVDPRFYANFKLSDQANLYASAAKGFRSGGFNASASTPKFGPEELWTYELGTKLSIPARSLSADADIFYSNYRHYVVLGIPGGQGNFVTSFYQNAGDAVIKGVEASMRWQPSDQWSLSLSGDYLDTYFTRIDLVPSSAPYAVGDNLDYINKYQYTASIEHGFKWMGRSGFVRADYSVLGPQTLRARYLPAFFNETKNVRMLNLTTGLDMNENLSVGLFAQNLLNDRNFMGADYLETQAARSRPRTFGINFTVRFE